VLKVPLNPNQSIKPFFIEFMQLIVHSDIGGAYWPASDHRAVTSAQQASSVSQSFLSHKCIRFPGKSCPWNIYNGLSLLVSLPSIFLNCVH